LGAVEVKLPTAKILDLQTPICLNYDRRRPAPHTIGKHQRSIVGALQRPKDAHWQAVAALGRHNHNKSSVCAVP